MCKGVERGRGTIRILNYPLYSSSLHDSLPISRSPLIFFGWAFSSLWSWGSSVVCPRPSAPQAAPLLVHFANCRRHCVSVVSDVVSRRRDSRLGLIRELQFIQNRLGRRSSPWPF